MTWVSVGVGAAGVLSGGISALGAGKQKKRIAREIANQKEVPLTNVADSMQVSTLGSDLQKEEAARLAATQTSALQEGGTRALLGGLGRVTANNQDVNAKIAADLDAQQTNINNLKAQDEGRIQSVKEQRAQAKLAALSSQYNAASQAQSQGLGNIIQGAGMAAGAYANRTPTAKAPREQVTSVNQITPSGLTTSPAPLPVGGTIADKFSKIKYDPITGKKIG